jgi:hypothetical protein
LNPHKPLGAFGFDSLMAIELRNRLQSDLALALSATLIWNYPTIADLAPHLAEKMAISLVTVEESGAPIAEIISSVEMAAPSLDQNGDKLDQILTDLETLSDEEALLRLLNQN